MHLHVLISNYMLENCIFYTLQDEFSDLLSREIQVDKEEQVYEAIMRWVRQDIQERIIALPGLLDKVAFDVMPTSYLTDILGLC